ncbi:hypothetical protein L6164_003533 [Bauhinia variegata]|uniref:Uncharacterized protein n=1 Tax=Bauhinia variegata TaxID=167791 RepID=A0ACB9Q1L3_BAUVA|nr:hypothetical protein L6164_003533 [Bauhinia variegata]
MARFLVFLLLLNLMAGFSTLPAAVYGDTVPVLSIDGGGIKGIIPAVILEYLESAIQKVSNDKNARVADYYDVVAGTSAGGLMTAMLTAPNPNNPKRPLFTAKEIVEFYKKECPHIFNGSEITMHATLMIQTKKSPELNALLSDIAISTSAAPTYLPSYNFKNGDAEFNMIDGAAFADNPAFVALDEVLQSQQGKKDTKFLLLSIGTGIQETKGWNATEAKRWSAKLDTLDEAKDEILESLEIAGKQLLKEAAKRMNTITFEPENINITNAEALDRLAETLYKLKQQRLGKISSLEMKKSQKILKKKATWFAFM